MKLPAMPFLALLGLALSCAAPERVEHTALEPQPSTPAALASPAPPVLASPLAKGVPGRIALTVRETAGVARAGEVVRSGVPLPRSLALRDPRTLTVVDSAGRPVPAELQVLARWNAGKDDASAPVQWLLAVFPATVAARGSAVYSLVADGTAGANPAPPVPLRLTRQGRQVMVDTGAAVFRLGGGAGTLFDEVVLPGGKAVVTGSGMALRAAGREGGHSTVRDVRIESAGPLSAVVIVDGAYDLPPVGNGGFGSRRRYVFTAGSPTALVRQAVSWEGDLECTGCLQTKDGKPNGVLVEKVRDTLALDLGGPASIAAMAVGDFKSAALEGPLPAGQEAAVRQLLRERRSAPLRFETAVAGERRQGARADGGMLALSGPAGSLAVGLNHMHRYEPQALRLLPDGRLAVDLVDDKAWLANHQGLFATFAVTVLPNSVLPNSALPGAARRADLDRLLWAPLNHPLRAWPDAAWFTASEAVDEVPAGTLPKSLASYDGLIESVLERTVEGIDREGLAGLMTFGVYPRYWGEKGSPGEIDCDDATPGEGWDNTFWCGNWTDYHNTVATAALWAQRSGQVEWLDELAFPGALRTLHTQIMQCGPGEKWFYCGQAPTGYGAYRADFNSSHAYFENLFLYYWLTGDSTVVDTVRRGGDSMRRLLCPSRGPSPVTAPHGPDGPACSASHKPDNDSASFTGRVAGQWLAAFRFLGLASDDPSFLEDYRSGLARAVTQHYTELERGGVRYGFLGEGVLKAGDGNAANKIVSEVGPAWTIGFYDAQNLYRLQRDTGDAPFGEPPLPPSHVLAALARTMVKLGPAKPGDAVEASWPRLLTITSSGPRIGGTLLGVEPKDRELYNPEKYGCVALLLRAGRQSGDPALTEAGETMVRLILRQARGDVLPLGKIQGQTLTRLHAAVALAAARPAAAP
ncbi:MAG TPA: hypothetical protein VKK31_23180 [Thermoanaerobaculia bacterium]|nr:hypothetical protein [Thermoanaerobaculia bacterium]